jgi:hypothetical protein
MMKAVKWIIIAVAVLLGLFVLVTLFLPKDYYVERTEIIEAPAVVIYVQIADLKAWQEWNPWKEMDPDMALTYGEATSGMGAWYSWESEIAGSGRMTIIEADPPKNIRFELLFKGYESVPSYSGFTLEGEELTGPVKVTWSFEGSVGDKLFARWMTLFIDKFVGESYENGLKALKERCEGMKVEDIVLTIGEPVG